LKSVPQASSQPASSYRQEQAVESVDVEELSTHSKPAAIEKLDAKPASTKKESSATERAFLNEESSSRTFIDEPTTSKSRTSHTTADLKSVPQASAQPASNYCEEQAVESVDVEELSTHSKPAAIEKLEAKPASTKKELSATERAVAIEESSRNFEDQPTTSKSMTSHTTADLKPVPQMSSQPASNYRQEQAIESVDEEEQPTRSKPATIEKLEAKPASTKEEFSATERAFVMEKSSSRTLEEEPTTSKSRTSNTNTADLKPVPSASSNYCQVQAVESVDKEEQPTHSTSAAIEKLEAKPASTKKELSATERVFVMEESSTITFVDQPTSSKSRTSITTADLKLVPQASSQPASKYSQEQAVESVDKEDQPTHSKPATIEKLSELKPVSTRNEASPIPNPSSSSAPSPRHDQWVEESSNVEREEPLPNSKPVTTKEMPPPPSRPPQGVPKSRPIRSLRIQKRKESPEMPPPARRRPKSRKNEPQLAEWAQCDLCDKWRTLPPHIPSSALPTVWHCSLITWDSSLASCSAPVEAYAVDLDFLEEVEQDFIAEVDDYDSETEEENYSDLDMPTPPQKSAKGHLTASPSNRKPTKVRSRQSDSVSCDEALGFRVYNLHGGGVKFVITNFDEMDEVFSNVLRLAGKAQAKEAAKKNPAARESHRSSKSTSPMPDEVHSNFPPTRIPTHNRRTRSQPTTENMASIPYSYGRQLDWDSINRCWKPASHPKAQSRSNRRSVGDEKKETSHSLEKKIPALNASSSAQAQNLEQKKSASRPAKGPVSFRPAVPDANISECADSRSVIQNRRPTMYDEITETGNQGDTPRGNTNALETTDEETDNSYRGVGRISDARGGNSTNQKMNRAKQTANRSSKTRPGEVAPGFYKEMDDLAADIPIRVFAANDRARSRVAETFDSAGERRVSSSDASVSLVSMDFPDHIMSQSASTTLELRRHAVAHIEDPRQILRHWWLTAILVGILMVTVSPTVIASYLFAFLLGVVFVYQGEMQLPVDDILRGYLW
jgi:hypothetical protein